MNKFMRSIVQGFNKIFNITSETSTNNVIGDINYTSGGLATNTSQIASSNIVPTYSNDVQATQPSITVTVSNLSSISSRTSLTTWQQQQLTQQSTQQLTQGYVWAPYWTPYRTPYSSTAIFNPSTFTPSTFNSNGFNPTPPPIDMNKTYLRLSINKSEFERLRGIPDSIIKYNECDSFINLDLLPLFFNVCVAYQTCSDKNININNISTLKIIMNLIDYDDVFTSTYIIGAFEKDDTTTDTPLNMIRTILDNINKKYNCTLIKHSEYSF